MPDGHRRRSGVGGSCCLGCISASTGFTTSSSPRPCDTVDLRDSTKSRSNSPVTKVSKYETELPVARRELHEEAGWLAPKVKHIATEKIVGDSCRRGSDAHVWHAYLAVFDPPGAIRLSGEGEDEQWLTLAEATAKELTYPVRYVIDR